MKDQLEGLVSQMVERGILFDEAVGEFEKRFIKSVLDRVDGNQSRAAHILGIHRNTLSRKIERIQAGSPAPRVALTRSRANDLNHTSPDDSSKRKRRHGIAMAPFLFLTR